MENKQCEFCTKPSVNEFTWFWEDSLPSLIPMCKDCAIENIRDCSAGISKEEVDNYL